ncbi:MAG: MFS transporter [Alistipes sp.]|nr:MFS transporter [Candidatus Alistipes equi]
MLNKKSILVVFVCLALAILVNGINKQHLTPFSSTIVPECPTGICVTKNRACIADKYGARVLITDGNLNLERIISVQSGEVHIDRIVDTYIDQDHIYIIGVNKSYGSDYILDEYLLQFNTKGEYERSLYHKTYEQGEHVTNGALQTMSIINGELALLSVEGRNIHAYTFDDTGQRMVERFQKTINEPVIFLSNVFHESGVLIYTINNHVYWLDLNLRELTLEHSEFWVNECLRYGIVYDDISQLGLESRRYCMVERRDDEDNILGMYCVKSGSNSIYTVARATGIIEEISQLRFSRSYLTGHILFWMSAFFILCLLLIFLAQSLRRIRFTKTIRTIIMIIAVIMITTGFYTMHIFSGQKELSNEWMEYQIDQMDHITQNFYRPMLRKLDQMGIERCLKDTECEQMIRSHIKTMEQSGYFGRDNYCFIRMFLLDEKHGAFIISDSEQALPIGKLCYTQSEVQNFIENSSSSISGAQDTFQYRVRFIPGENSEKRFMLMNYYSTTTMQQVQKNYAITLFIALLSILIALYISLSRLSNLRRNISQYLSKRRMESNDAKFSLCNTFNFVFKFSTDMDLFIQVFVVQYFISSEMDSLATMTAEVLVCYSLGSVIGTMLVAWIRKALGNKRTGIIGSLLALLAFAMMVIAIKTSQFQIFCIARLIFGFAIFGMIRTVLEGIPLEAEDINIRSRLIWSSITSQQAASVMAILAGGCILEYLPPYILYYIGICLATIMLVLSNLALSPKKHKIPGLGRAVVKDIRSFFSSRPIVRFIFFVTLPSLLMEGYTEYLFPLYANDFGFSPQMLTTVILLGITLNYMFMPALDKFFATMGNRKAIGTYLIFLASCLIMVILSPGIHWALIIFLLMLIIKKNGCESVHFTDLVDANGLDQQDCNVNYNMVESGILSIRPVLLRSFYAVGKNYATVIIGALCGTLIGIYLLLKPDKINNHKP